jgi:hypothetical protein
MTRLLTGGIVGCVLLMPSLATAQEGRTYGEAVYALNRHQRARDSLQRDRDSASSDAAAALEKVEVQQRELAVHAAERRHLDALREEADRLRGETDRAGQGQQPQAETEQLPESDYASRLWNWFHAEKREPQTPASTRTREEIDEELRRNGVTIEIDGDRITQPCESLAQLDSFIKAETKRVDDLIKGVKERIRDEEANAAKYEESVRQLNQRLETLAPGLEGAESQVIDEKIKSHNRYSDLSSAVGEQMGLTDGTKAPSMLEQLIDDVLTSKRPGKTNITPASECTGLFQAILDEVSWPSHLTGPKDKPAPVKTLLGDLDQDRMTSEEYEQYVERRDRENQGSPIDEATRREAAAIHQQVAQREQQMWEAEQRYQQAVRNQVAQVEIQRRWNQQQASRQQWMQAIQQQQALQQFGNDFGNLFGGSGAAAPTFANPSSRGSYTPNRTRPANDGRSGSRKPSSSRVKSNQRQNRDAQGFKDLFR